jgi:hypothetical protein
MMMHLEDQRSKQNNWKTTSQHDIILEIRSSQIQDFPQAIFHEVKDRENTTPCFLIHNTFYHFLTIDNKYTYSPFHTRHLNNLHLKGDIAFVVHVPGHWLISITSFLKKEIIVLDPIDTQRYSTEIADNLRLL